MSYYENMKAIRKEHKESQQELAEIINWSRPQIARYETGVSVPTVDYLIAFCKHYKISADWILELPKYRRK